MGEGIPVGSLSSGEMDAAELKDVIKVFSMRCDDMIPSESNGIERPFQDVYWMDLETFCIAVACQDGPMSDRELSRINWLLDDDLSIDFANETYQLIMKFDWIDRYPVSFKYLVRALGQEEYEDPSCAADLANASARMYFHIAKYIYEADNSEPYGEKIPTYWYVTLFGAYTKRVGAIGFDIPEGEKTIEDTLVACKRVIEDEISDTEHVLCGSWNAIKGNAISNKGLSDMILKSDGTGQMIRRGLFGAKKDAVEWRVEMVSGSPVPAIFVPNKGLSAVCVLDQDSGQLFAIVKQPQRLLNTMAIYRKQVR